MTLDKNRYYRTNTQPWQSFLSPKAKKFNDLKTTSYISGGLFRDLVQYQVNPWQGWCMLLEAQAIALLSARRKVTDNYEFL
jgi:hypothetical protein